MKNKVLLGLALLIVSNASFALESIVGKVTVVEPSYMPTIVYFQMDSGNTTCPAGTWFKWNHGNTANLEAILSTLTAALLAGQKVNFYINDGDTNCFGQYLHLTNQQ